MFAAGRHSECCSRGLVRVYGHSAGSTQGAAKFSQPRRPQQHQVCRGVRCRTTSAPRPPPFLFSLAPSRGMPLQSRGAGTHQLMAHVGKITPICPRCFGDRRNSWNEKPQKGSSLLQLSFPSGQTRGHAAAIPLILGSSSVNGQMSSREGWRLWV